MARVMLPPTWDPAWQHPAIPPVLGLGPDLNLWTLVTLAAADRHHTPFRLYVRPVPDEEWWEVSDGGYILQGLACQVPAAHAADPATPARWWTLAVATRFGLQLDPAGACGGLAPAAAIPALVEPLIRALHTVGRAPPAAEIFSPALLQKRQ